MFAISILYFQVVGLGSLHCGRAEDGRANLETGDHDVYAMDIDILLEF
jgi:hypothetical protein